MHKTKGIILGLLITAVLLSGCGLTPSAPAASAEPAKVESDAEEKENVEEEPSEEESVEALESVPAETQKEAEAAESEAETNRKMLRIGALKGPTTIGLLALMDDVESGAQDLGLDLSFTMETEASALAAQVVSGEVDIALLPANLAAVLYQRTNGEVAVLNINTMGVLECVSAEPVTNMGDLKGKTILTTGQGATPEYAIRYLMAERGIADYTLEFHAEATEIAVLLTEEPSQIAILPQPFATAATMQNEKVQIRFALADEWTAMVTGVTLCRREVLDMLSAGEVETLMRAQGRSAKTALTDPERIGALAEEKGIVGKAAIAAQAIPRMGIPSVDGIYTGREMKGLLSAYLETLYDADPESVGGELPDYNFYYIP